MRVHSGPGAPGTKHFLLSDQLGSTSTVLSATGAVEESQPDGPSGKYYPYGSLRSGSITLTDKPARRGGKFTGQQEEGTAFGLYDYGARFYSTTLGRFISADPLVAGNYTLTANLMLRVTLTSHVPETLQSFDRYAYVVNNPLTYVDPAGLRYESPYPSLCDNPAGCEIITKMLAYRTGHSNRSSNSSSGLMFDILSADSCVNGGVDCPKAILDYWDTWRFLHWLVDQGWTPDVTDSDVSWQDQQRAVAIARAQVGKPYVSGAKGPNAFDCSGLVYWSYQQVGVDVALSTYSQWPNTTRISASELRPGDLIFYYPGPNGPEHVTMYIADGMMVESPAPGGVVQEVAVRGGAMGYGRPHY
jgi:RHS repeat-associated protein